MGTKQTSLRAAKQAKRKQKAKIRQSRPMSEKPFVKQKVLTPDANGFNKLVQDKLNEMRNKVKSGELTQEQYDTMMIEFMDEHELITNEKVLQAISDIIPGIVKTHGGIELFLRLAEEGRYTVTAEQLETFVEFDKATVAATEDIGAIHEFIEAGSTPGDYTLLFLSFQDNIVTISEKTTPVVDALGTQADLLNEYAKQHADQTKPMYDYLLQLHIERMTRVGPLYRVAPVAVEQPLHPYTPANPSPVDLMEEPVTVVEVHAEPEPVKEVQ